MLRRVFSGASDWKAISAVLVVLLVGEVSLSFGEGFLSVDVRHIKQFPAIVRSFDSGREPVVLFLGNSLTRAGIRPDVMESTWSSQELPRTRVALIHPDDTRVLDWYYVYRRFVETAPSRPRVIIVCFAQSNLDDNHPVQLERLGSQFSGFPLLAEAFSHEVLTLSDRMHYLLGAVSRLWANRERVQTRVLALIPGYEAMAQTLNTEANARQNSTKSGQPGTYGRLARFIERLTLDGADVVFVATPLPKRYPLPEELRRTIRDGGAELLDLQGTVPAEPGNFPDGYHLSPAAAERFSASLGTALAASDDFRSALMRGQPANYSAFTGGRSHLGAAAR